MSSVDGRLLTDRWTQPYGGKSKNELLGVYASAGRRLATDAWMFGKNTLVEGFFMRPTSRRRHTMRRMRPGAVLTGCSSWPTPMQTYSSIRLRCVATT